MKNGLSRSERDPADHVGEARPSHDRRGRPAADRIAYGSFMRIHIGLTYQKPRPRHEETVAAIWRSSRHASLSLMRLLLATVHWLRYLFGRILGFLHPRAENDRERDFF
jgi:hypothetical protein